MLSFAKREISVVTTRPRDDLSWAALLRAALFINEPFFRITSESALKCNIKY